MGETEQAATWVDTLLSCCDPFIKSKRGKIITTAVTIALATFDVITDWYNWYSWTQFKPDEVLTGYEIKILASTIKYERLFWFVAVTSTVLFVMELIKAAIKMWQINTNKTPVRKFNDPESQPSYFSLFCSVVGALIGTLEDLPVVVASYHLAVTPVCAAPAKKYLKSAAGIAALTASVVNSSWKLLVLHFRTICEWFSRKEIDRKILEKLLNLLLFVLFFLSFGLVNQTLTHLSVPRYLLFGFYGFILVAMAIKSCKNLTDAKDCTSNDVIIWLKAMTQQVHYLCVLFSFVLNYSDLHCHYHPDISG